MIQSRKLQIKFPPKADQPLAENKKHMSYEEEEEVEDGFKIGADEDELGEPLDAPEGITDFGLDEEDPDKDR